MLPLKTWTESANVRLRAVWGERGGTFCVVCIALCAVPRSTELVLMTGKRETVISSSASSRSLCLLAPVFCVLFQASAYINRYTLIIGGGMVEVDGREAENAGQDRRGPLSEQSEARVANNDRAQNMPGPANNLGGWPLFVLFLAYAMLLYARDGTSEPSNGRKDATNSAPPLGDSGSSSVEILPEAPLHAARAQTSSQDTKSYAFSTWTFEGAKKKHPLQPHPRIVVQYCTS